jgi:hypothetical protein
MPNPPTITVTATSQANTSQSASATVTVTGAAGAITVTPGSATVATFGTQQFTASVSGVTWQVNGIAGGSQTLGFISSSGLFVAPGNVPTTSDGKGGSVTTTVTVTAVATSGSGSATVIIQPGNQNAESGAVELGSSGGNSKDSSTSGNTITCCGGTLGSLVTQAGTQYILSNNHVLARSDQAPQPTPGTTGEAIIQPGLVDTPKCSTTGTRTVANLSAFYNLETGTAPKIDAAIAKVISGDVDSAGNILYLGATADANGTPVPEHRTRAAV